MNDKKIIYWHNGLFLKPHHFQYLQIHIQSMIRDYVNVNSKHNWGLIEFELDESKLNNYELHIKKGIFFFKDGTLINYPKNAIINIRTFTEAIKNRSSLKCYIGIKKLSEYESNVTDVESEVNLNKIETRFIVNKDDKSHLENNLYEDNDKIDMVYLDYYLKIFFEDEINAISDYEILPIALLENKEGRISLSKSYSAPSLNIFTNKNLENILTDIYKYLFSHVNKLEEYKPQYNYKSSTFNISQQLIGLQSIIEFIPTLEEYTSANRIHPWEIYSSLIKLASKLSVFTNRINVKGKDINGEILLKEYKHDDIYSCFNSIKELIFNLLDDLCISPDKIIDFIYKDDMYFANVLKDFLTDEYNFYMSIKSDDNDSFMRNLTFIKISTSQNITEIVGRSLPGLDFEVLKEPPLGLPKLSNTSYIKLKTDSNEWLNIKYSQNIAIFFSDLQNEVNIQLIIIKD